MSDKAIAALDRRYPGLWERLDEIATAESCFEVFRALSDNYSPTLTVSRVQGAHVASLLEGSGARVDANLRGSGSIGVTVGAEPAPVWLSAHADICSYLTGDYDGTGYSLVPFCMHRARPGRRAAVALGAPRAAGPLERLAEGEMVTHEDGRVTFESDVSDLPRWTRVVHHLPAAWNRDSDEIVGFIDNQAGSAALIVAARVLAGYNASVLLVLNDEEEGPVNPGNRGFSRALGRLLNRTPHGSLPGLVVVSDAHQQERALEAREPTYFGRGALYTGEASGARGAVTPPHLLAAIRELADPLAERDILLTENGGYVSRSDDVSALHYTPNIALVGFAGAYAHFDRTPVAHAGDIAQLAKVLVVLALLAQSPGWRERAL